MSMKLFKKSVVLLVVLSILFTNALTAFASDLTITYDDYKKAVVNEYAKYGFKVDLSDPENSEITITKKMLNDRLEEIRKDIEAAQIINNSLPLIQPKNNVQTRNMPYVRTAYFDQRIIAPTVVYGYGNFQAAIKYNGNAQYGTVTGISNVSLKQIGFALNLSNWSYNGFNHSLLGYNSVIVYVYVTTTFSWSDPVGGTISHTSEHTINCQVNG